MRIVRHVCFVAILGIVPATLAPLGSAWGQEVAAPSASAAPAADGKPRAAASTGKSKAAADRLNLETTKVLGNRELPKVLYIVPWKRADIGELPGQPINSLLDEVLAPLDRDEYRREIRYYEAIVAPANQPAAARPVSESAPSQSMPTEK